MNESNSPTIKQLWDAHALIDTILTTAPIGFGLLDRQLRYLRINKALADINGLPIEAHIGRHVAEIVPTLAETVREVTDRIVATGEAVKDHEFSGETPSAPGVTRYWNESWYPVHDETGTLIGFGVVAEEITARKQSEEAVRESELRFRALTERIGDVFWISDPPSKKLVYVSQAFADVWGRGLQELYDRFELWLDAVHEDDRVRVGANFFEHIYAGTYDVEYRVVRPDGSIRWVRDRGKPLGIRDLVAGVAEDITERKQGEEALRRSEERWQLAVTGSTDGIWDWDIAGHTVFLSSRWKEMRGYQEDETGADETEWSSRIHPEDYSRVMTTVQAYLKKDLPDFHCEYRTRCKDGTYLWIVDRGIAIWDERGQAVRMVGSETDITLRKQAEEQLREKEERLRVLTTAMPQLVWACSSTGECIYQSPQWETVTGQSATDSLRFGWAEMIHPEDRARAAEEWRTTVAQGTTYQTEYRLHMKDGTYRWYLARAESLRDESGAIVQWIGTSTDIEEAKRTEAALREGEARLRLAMQGAGLAAWDMDLRTGINRWDDRLPALLGVKTEEEREASARWPEFIHPDDRDRVLREFTAAGEGHGVFNSEFRVSRADGSIRWFASWGHLIEGDESKRITGLVQDITDRKQAEEALRESEERLRSILNRAPAAIFIKDPAGRYLFMNEQCARVLSVNREQALGGTDRDFLSPELAAQFMANDQQVWESDRLMTVKERVPQADGVHISLVQKFLLRDSQGRPYALSGIALDITHHLQLEATIQASEARLQLAQSAANIGVFDWDITAQNGVWSPELERIWGLPVGSFDGTVEAWRRLVHPDDRTSAHAGILRSLEDPTTASEFEYRIVRLDGAVRWIYAKVKTLCDAEGQAVRMVGVNLDITDRKEAQLRLERFAEELERQVTRRTQELVSSQDRLRTLATELNLAEQRERKRLATELHDHLQQMLVVGKIAIGQGKRVAVGIPACESALQRVDSILSDALTYSRTLVAELCPPVLHEHGLVAGLKWLAEHLKNRQEQTVTVIAPEDHELHLAEDQRVLLFQSIRELLINAAKHAGTGEATVVLIERADQIQIEVRDYGRGFDLAAAAGTPNDGISSKFGLFSIQERMRVIGGSFEIQSSPGMGTTATLVLPLEKKPVGPLHASESLDKDAASLASAHSRGPCVRVLLVDDHLMVRQGLRAILDAYADIELVAEAGDGEEAVRLIGQWRPDVVVMDINMPRMNGIDATMQIKLRYPETIIIGLSVNAAGENQEAMERAGAVRLMTKEAAVEQLYDAIQEAWRQRTLTQEASWNLDVTSTG